MTDELIRDEMPVSQLHKRTDIELTFTAWTRTAWLEKSKVEATEYMTFATFWISAFTLSHQDQSQ